MTRPEAIRAAAMRASIRATELLATALLACGLAAAAPQGDVPRLKPGTAYASAVRPGDPRADVSGLPAETAERLGRARRFALHTGAAGPYAFDLRSHHFDAFLIVRDARGELVAAADGGGFGTHAALDALELEGDAVYAVDACAPGDAVGELTILVRAGGAEPLSRDEEIEARLEDARERIFAIERRDGYVSAALADACERQGLLQGEHGLHREARASFERALGILQELYGEESSEAGRAMLRVADTFVREGDHESARLHYDVAAATLAAARGAAPDLPPDAPAREGSSATTGATTTGDGSAGDDGSAATRGAGPGADELAARLGSAVSSAALGDPAALDALRAVAEAAAESDADGAARARRALGRELVARGRLDEGEAVLAAALAATPPGEAPADAELLAELLAVRGRAAEAEALLVERLERLEAERGRDHPATADLHVALADRRLESGRPGEAFAEYERAWLLREASLGAGHPRLARAALGTAAALASAGDLEGAAAQVRVYLGAAAEPAAGEPPDRLRAFADLARLETALGDARAAAQRIESARAAWVDRAGDRLPDVLDLAVDAALAAVGAEDAEAAWWSARGALDTAAAHLADDLWALAPDARLALAEVVRRALDAVGTALPAASRPEREAYAFRAWLAWRCVQRPELLGCEAELARGRTTEQWIHVLRHRGLAAQLDAELHAEHVADPVLHVERLADLRRRAGYLKWEHEVVDGPARTRRAPEVVAIVDALPEGGVLVDLATYRPWRAPGADGTTPGGWDAPRARAWLLRSGDPAVERFELGPTDDVAAPAGLVEALAGAREVLVCPADGLDELVPHGLLGALPAGMVVRLLPDPAHVPGVLDRAAAADGPEGPGGVVAVGVGEAVAELRARAVAAGRAPSAVILWTDPAAAGGGTSWRPADRWSVTRRAAAGPVRAAPRDRLRPGLPDGVYPSLAEVLPMLAPDARGPVPGLGDVETVIVRGATPALLRALHAAGARTALAAPSEASEDELLAVLHALWLEGADAADATPPGWLVSGA